jgi:O-antigen/teichoic acid export membrane protein
LRARDFTEHPPAAKSGGSRRMKGLRRILGNSGWMAAEQLLRVSVGFGVSIALARQLGPSDFGRLNAALALVSVFAVVAALGLNRFAVRELARAAEPAAQARLACTVSGLRLAAALPVVLAALAAATLWHLAETGLVLILAAAYLFAACDATDLYFQARLESRTVARVRSLAFGAATALKILLLLADAGVYAFAWAYLFEAAASAAALDIAFRQHGHRLTLRAVDWAAGARLLGESWTEILAGLSGLMFMRMDQLLLNAMRGPADAGLLAVSVLLSEAWYFVPTAVVASAFPELARQSREDPAGAQRRIAELLRLLTGVAVAVGLALCLASPWLVEALFGPRYHGAALPLAITAWCGLFTAWGVASGAWLIATGRARLNLWRNIAGAVINLALNIALIPHYGAPGAAFATLVAMASAYFLFDFLSPALRPIGLLKARSLVLRAA